MDSVIVLAYSLFFALIIALVLVGMRSFSGRTSRLWRTAREERWWIVLLLLGTVLSIVWDRLNRTVGFHLTPDQTPLISQFFGWVPMELQHLLYSPLLTYVLGAVYLISLPAILILAPLLLLYDGEELGFCRYAFAIAAAYTGLIFLDIAVPVVRPGLYPPSGITPLLYDSSVLGPIAQGFGTHSNSFPSGHTTLITTTLLVFASLPTYRRFTVALTVTLAAVIFSILYLGLHWPADVLLGMILALIAWGSSRFLVR